jgi:hypothetical protein
MKGWYRPLEACEVLLYPPLHPWGNMASTQSKLSGAKTGARSVSSSRLVAQKPAKPQKLAAAVKPRTSPSNAPASIGKASGRWPKTRTSVPPSAEPKTEVRSAAATPVEDKTRSGASKSELKTQFAKLSSATSQIASLKRSLNKTFFDVGVLLNQVRNERLYEVKGYGSFESFVEREIDITKALCLKIGRIAEALQRDQALAAGLERAAAAVAALDGEAEPSAGFRPAGSPAGGIPVHKQ